MPLQQINLKIQPAVLDHWRTQAAAQGLSVRAWLVGITASTVELPARPADAAELTKLTDRVAALEAVTTQLRKALLQDRPPLSEIINFRATLGEREQLQALAARKGVTVADLIRQGLKLQGFQPER